MGRKLSILFVSYEYPDKNGKGGGGGIANVYAELSRGLSILGHDVWVITHAPDDEQRYIEDGVQVWRIPSDPTKKDTPERVRSRSLAVSRAVRSLLRTKRFDLIQFPEFNGEGYDLLNDCVSGDNLPHIVVRLHSSTKPYKALNHLLSPDERRIMEMEKAVLEKCDTVISPCKATWEAVRRSMGIDKKSLYILPNSIDCDRFAPARKEPKKEPFVFGFVGKLSHAKGIDTIVGAFAQLVPTHKNIRLVVIGRDKFRHPFYRTFTDWLSATCPEDVRKRIIVSNYTPRSSLVHEYRKFHGFLFASRYENFPNTVMEAMACGLPLVASRVGGVPELLGARNPSLLFEAGDVNSLAQGMVRMLTDDDLRKKAGAYNRSRILNEFSTDRITADGLALYKRLVDPFKR